MNWKNRIKKFLKGKDFAEKSIHDFADVVKVYQAKSIKPKVHVFAKWAVKFSKKKKKPTELPPG